MTDPRAAERSRAFGELRRIRAVESAPDEEGVRTVWHQAANGSELVSWVNDQGRVIRQDFTLLEDHFSWSSQGGLRTGQLSGTPGSKAGPAAGLVALDPNVVGERLRRAADAVLTYEGEDRYLTHLRRILELTARGLAETDEETVTSRWSPKAEHSPPDRKPLRTALGIAGALLVAGVAVWLFAR